VLLSARPARAVVFAGPLILDGGSMLSKIICLGVHQAVMRILGHLGRVWVMGSSSMTHEREPENIVRAHRLGHLGHVFISICKAVFLLYRHTALATSARKCFGAPTFFA
jgi:hypothetical protein